MSEGLLNGLYIIPILAVLIIIHEIGHFASARAVGVTVEEFGIGIPPRIKGWTRNGVIWSLNAIPFGGFVRVLGEDGKNADPGSMNTKGPGQRAFFLVAGSAMNVLLALVLMIAVIAIHGRPAANAVVNSVQAGSPAERAALQVGDRIVRIGDVEIETGEEIRSAALAAAGRSVPFVVEREGKLVELSVTPRVPANENEGPTGITLSDEFKPVPILESIPQGFSQTWRLTVAMVDGLRQLVTGGVALNELAGPIGMGQMTSVAVSADILPLWVTLAQLSILISLNLAVLNLLPLPALDGGRLLFVLIEVLRGGRRIAPEREGLVHFAGLVILLGFMFVIAFLDVGRLVGGRGVFP